MNLFSFLTNEMKRSPVPMLMMATIGGAINAVLLSAFSGISSAEKEGPELHSVLLILTTMVLYYFTKKYTLLTSMNVMEEMINSIRKRIIGKLRHSDLASFEKLDNSSIYSLLTQEVNTLSMSVNSIVNAFQSCVIVLFCMIYIGITSVAALLTMLIAFGLGAMTYIIIRKDSARLLQKLMREDSKFFSALNQLLSGFKEIKLHARKDKDVFHNYALVTRRLKVMNLRSGKLFSMHMIHTQGYFYALIGVVVFLLPGFADIDKDTAMSITIATLFMVAPLLMCLSAFPEISRANIAIENLYRMEKSLDNISTPKIEAKTNRKLDQFDKISFRKLMFRFPPVREDEKPYQIGPLDLEINRAEILFIVGGNGSGKTTLLKVLTGLYQKTSGSISINNRNISPAMLPEYRELFTGVFADYHLFDRLYGVEDISEDYVNDLIHKMELDEKTHYQDNRFSNVKLSQGQRKRLGLIVSLIEDKPIYIFDEWAADQDPHFKEFFYEDLLPGLKAKGKTVIVISHDDRYFRCADRVVVMDFGKIAKIMKGNETRPTI